MPEPSNLQLLRRNFVSRNLFSVVILALLTTSVSAADVKQPFVPESEPLEEIPDADPEPTPELRKQFKKNLEIQDSIEKSDTGIESNLVVLRGLNKVIGRVSKLEVPLGTLARFENLEIIARKCVKSPPDEQPENVALLEIRELKSGESPKQIFLGWMLSSNPAISSLEHPVYDIMVLSCEYRKNLETD